MYIVVYRRQEFGPPFTTHWCETITVTSTPTGITLPDFQTLSVLKIYPNPTEGLISFDINLTESSDINIQIYNVLGELLLQVRCQIYKARYIPVLI